MTACQELEYELESHAVHMRHRQYADDIVASMYLLAKYSYGKVVVAPHGTIGNHHSLGESCCSTRVVDKCHVVGILLGWIAYVFFPEIFWIFLSEHLVQVLTGICKFVSTREGE